MVWQSQIKVIVTFLVVFGDHANALIIVKVKICMLVKWSYWSPRIC